MFHQLFQHPPTIERHQTAPLLEERRSYLAHCADQGRTKSSLRHDLEGYCSTRNDRGR